MSFCVGEEQFEKTNKPRLNGYKQHGGAAGGGGGCMPFRDSSLVISQCSASPPVTVQAAAIGLAHINSTVCDRFRLLGLCRQSTDICTGSSS